MVEEIEHNEQQGRFAAPRSLSGGTLSVWGLDRSWLGRVLPRHAKMMTGGHVNITEAVLAKRTDILRVSARRHATDVRLIGSVARGEAGPESDIDLVVRFLPSATTHDRAVLADELGLLLGRRVEVISETSLLESTRDRLATEALLL